MNYDDILAGADGDIKVNVQDVRQLYIAISNNDNKYIQFFEKKYLELTSIRIQERQAYDYYMLSKKISKSSGEEIFVHELKEEYLKTRTNRMMLQNEISEYERKNSILVSNDKKNKKYKEMSL